MKFLTKIKDLNHYISFHIFAASGLYETFVIIYIYKEIEKYQKMYPNNCSANGFDWVFIGLTGFYIILLSISYIVFLFEKFFKHKIGNKFILTNKIYNIVIYIGAIFSLIYFIFLTYFLIDMTVIQTLFPSDLIYSDTLAK